MSKEILLLDCTLRDGGYVNEWDFGYEGSAGIANSLYNSGIDFIEIGIMGKSRNTGTTKFNNIGEVESLARRLDPRGRYTFMLNYSEKDDFEIPERNDNIPPYIRLAFFGAEWRNCIEYAKELSEKGYTLCLQTMATQLYSDNELLDLIKEINKIKPFSFYIVDSFGVMYNKDVLKTAKLVDEVLDSEIAFGFHSHNNIQMAFSNAMTFIELDTDRALMVDSSIYGMGRGAGNLTTELIAQYLNNNFSKNYKIDKILQAYDDYIRDIFKKFYWGYSMEYYVTAAQNTNSAYGWYLNNKRDVNTLKELSGVLANLPDEMRYSLFPKYADEALEKYRSGYQK